MYLASTAGAAGAAGVWSLTVLIQDHMNSWKRLLFGTGTEVGVGLGPGDARPGVGRLMAGLPRRVGGIVESGERGRSEERGQSRELG